MAGTRVLDTGLTTRIDEPSILSTADGRILGCTQREARLRGAEKW